MKPFYLIINEKGSDFTIQLAKEINLKGSWEIALTEIQMDNHVKPEINLILQMKVLEMNEEKKIRWISSRKSLTPLQGYEIKYENQVLAFIKIIENQSLELQIYEKDYIKIRAEQFDMPPELTNGTYQCLDPQAGSFIFDIEVRENYTDILTTEFDYEFKFKDIIHDMSIKLPKESSISSNKLTVGLNTVLQLSSDLSNLLSLPQNRLITGDYEINVKNVEQIDSLLILTDLVSSQFVNDTLLPVLRSIEVKSRIYNTPYYVPLSRNCFQSIRVFIRTINGLKIHFKQGSNTRLVLHFRPC
jgi:hypothetical protein